MEDISYDVRIYKTDVWRSAREGGPVTYWVRWKVGKRAPFKRPFRTSALAENFRSGLLAAASRGEAFRQNDGLPVSTARAQNEMSWYEFACSFVDMKWSRSAATTRRTHAEAMRVIHKVR